MKGPKLQNIPIRTEAGKQIRDALIRPGPSMNIDYASIERRILDRYGPGCEKF